MALLFEKYYDKLIVVGDVIRYKNFKEALIMQVGSKKQSEEIKECLQRKDVQQKISIGTVNVNVSYPEFEFLIFKNGQNQFRDRDCNKKDV